MKAKLKRKPLQFFPRINSCMFSNSALLQVQNLIFTFGNSMYPNIDARCAAFSLMFFLWNSLFAMVWALFCNKSQGRKAKKRKKKREISFNVTHIIRIQQVCRKTFYYLNITLSQQRKRQHIQGKYSTQINICSYKTERKRNCSSPVSFFPPGAEDAQALQKGQLQQNRQMRDFQRFLTDWAGYLVFVQSLLSWPYDQNHLKTV